MNDGTGHRDKLTVAYTKKEYGEIHAGLLKQSGLCRAGSNQQSGYGHNFEWKARTSTLKLYTNSSIYFYVLNINLCEENWYSAYLLWLIIGAAVPWSWDQTQLHLPIYFPQSSPWGQNIQRPIWLTSIGLVTKRFAYTRHNHNTLSPPTSG